MLLDVKHSLCYEMKELSSDDDLVASLFSGGGSHIKVKISRELPS